MALCPTYPNVCVDKKAVARELGSVEEMFRLTRGGPEARKYWSEDDHLLMLELMSGSAVADVARDLAAIGLLPLVHFTKPDADGPHRSVYAPLGRAPWLRQAWIEKTMPAKFPERLAAYAPDWAGKTVRRMIVFHQDDDLSRLLQHGEPAFIAAQKAVRIAEDGTTRIPIQIVPAEDPPT